ncbi:hypothetical protein ACOSP7_006313 [Xanthoceras sorbifolium]
MEDERAIEKDLSILLGKPFMATAKTIIDVQNGKLSITVMGEIVEFQFTMDELNELLELEIELEKEELEKAENAERHCLGSTEGKDGLEIDLGVVKKRYKPRRPKPSLEEMTCEEELQLLNTSSEDPISDSKWLREHLAGHVDDNILDVH